MSRFLKQTWTLTKKDLLILVRRKWFSTLLRAVILPIAVTLVLAYTKVFIASKGDYGVGSPFTILSLPDALAASASARDKFVIVDHTTGKDAKTVIDELSDVVRSSSKALHISHESTDIQSLCPSSSGGITNCFAAVEFWSSPSEGPGSHWNYTLWFDAVIGGSPDIANRKNDVQIYAISLQHFIDAAIGKANGGPQLPEKMFQFMYTTDTNEEEAQSNLSNYEQLVQIVLAFAFFIGLCGITYHLTGHITFEREQGMLELIDAMMPNSNPWECLTIRSISSHLAFDLVYAPGWIAMGAIAGVVAFPATHPGWLILLYIMTGLALSSFSVLASSLFRRTQLSAISTIVTVLCLAIVAQFAEQGGYTTNDAGIIATALLFPPSTFVYFLVDASKFELEGFPLSISGSLSNLSAGTRIPNSALFGFLAFQLVLYPVLGCIAERYLWGNSLKGRYLRSQTEMEGNAVRLRKFSKTFRAAKKKSTVHAVKELSLDLHAGSITVLLGANGSGKSTTLNSIAGLAGITSGEVEIDGTGGIGICPQKNILFGMLTVEEHIWLFERLKNPSLSRSQSKAEVQRLIVGCDLEVKAKARAKSLSGGQMRKLQLAMMLAGGSKVCCIDEASSGIDPLARRKIWDILLNERGQRTMLLTTHFLDESEVLSDHIAVLSKGELRAEGSVAYLKGSSGGGYSVILSKHDEARVPEPLPAGIHRKHDYNDSVYESSNVETLTPFLSALEHKGITGYQVRGPTIENVFLNLAEEMQLRGDHEKDLATDETFSSPSAMKLNPGKGCGPVKQTFVLFLKRLTVFKHNFMPYVAALFFPLTLAGLVTLFLKGQTVDAGGIQCSRGGSSVDFAPYSTSLQPSSLYDEIVFGPPDKVSTNLLSDLVPNGTFYSSDSGSYNYGSWEPSQSVGSYTNFQSGLNNSEIFGGFFIGSSNTTFAFAGGEGAYSAAFIQATLDMVLLNTTIAFSYGQFRSPYQPTDFFQGILAVFTVLGFAIYPGFFSLYPTAERLRNVRAMHYSNGILASSLWTAYALFDFMFILLISVLATVIWATQYSGWYGLGYVFVVFLLYGMAGTAYSYVISLFVPSQLSAMAATSLIQVVIAMLFFVAYFVTWDNAPPTEIYNYFNYIYYTMALICPAISLFRALLVTLNVYALACQGPELAAYPGGISRYGGPILYLTVQYVFLIAFLAFWESGRSLEVFGIRSRKKNVDLDADSGATIADAQEDHAHLASSNDGVRVHRISKTFGTNKAVDDVSFGILPSEKFALLGPNGAGKSTMISLLRGDLLPNHSRPAGSICISGDDLASAPVLAKSHLGVCPQFDSVDSMTLREHLNFYARARGVPDKDTNVRELITRLGLTDHADKLVKKLSGGTKRKLSLAIALISNPTVLLLDEPSSGMDAVAKRALWSTLSAISAGRCLLLTTHSMEEANALCDRAGIMARKMLALGSISDLRARHGDKIYIHLVHKNAPYTSAEQTEALWAWVRETFLVAEAEPRSFGGQVRFAVPVKRPDTAVAGSGQERLLDGSHMGALFKVVEAHKGRVGIQDYSIGPTTLDQVFLNVVTKHNVEEENVAPPTKGSKGFFEKALGK